MQIFFYWNLANGSLSIEIENLNGNSAIEMEKPKKEIKGNKNAENLAAGLVKLIHKGLSN